mgnify:CR=1 FL=1
MSSLETLSALFEQQNKAWSDYRQVNDERLKQLEQKGAADAVTVEKLEKLSAELDRLGDNFKALERLATLPNRGDAGGDKAAAERLAMANRHLQELAAEKGKRSAVFDSAEQLAKYESDFRYYLRQGRAGEPAMAEWVRQDFQIAVDSDGGFLVPHDMSGRIVTRLYEMSDVRAVVNIDSTNRSELIGIADTADVNAWWAGEAEPDAEGTNTGLGEYAIQVEEMRTQPKASLRMLEDSAWNVERWLEGKIGSRFGRLESAAVVSGDGSRKPRGFLAYPTATTADLTRPWGTLQRRGTGASGALGTNPFDVLIDMIADLKPAYRGNARWAANRATFAQYRKVKDTTGEYLWQPPVQAGAPSTLLGYPIAEMEDMPAIAASSFSLAFGDFRETYTLVDRLAISILRDPLTAKGWVKFFTRKRLGGGVVNFDSLKLLQFV